MPHATDGFPLAVVRGEPREPPGPHTDCSAVAVVTAGRGLYRADGDTWPLSAGDVFVITGEEAAEYRDHGDLAVTHVLYRPERLKWDVGDLRALPGYHALFTLEPQWRRRHEFNSRLRLTPAEVGHVLGLIDQLDAELAGRAPGFGYVATALFMLLVGSVSRAYGRSGNPDAQALLRIAATITHLETRYAEEVKLDDLAAMADLPTRSFQRVFEAATGESPIAYRIRVRVRRAADRLRATDDPIPDVALGVGFPDSNYFARQFRRVLGVTPREYRAANRGVTAGEENPE